jgi:hypothetical protein
MNPPRRPEPPLGAAAQKLMVPGLTPASFVERLQSQDLNEDALIFTAYVLPPRDLAWWGCLCAWKDARPSPPAHEEEAFRASMRWIQNPSEETRRGAGAAARHAGLRAPAGIVAQAVFCSGGSIGEPGQPSLEPPPETMPDVMIAALRVAAAREDVTAVDRCYRRYVWLARDVLQRLSRGQQPARKTDVQGSLSSQWPSELG